VSRPPQGHPVIIQSGSSEEGKEKAAKWGELIFTAQLSFEHAREFYADVKSRLAKFGRSPEDVKIAPGVFFILGDTHDEALENEAQLNSFVDTKTAANRLSVRLGIDLLSLPLDKPLSVENARRADEVNGPRSRHQLILEMVKRESLTPRQLIHRLAGGRGHYHFVGTPAKLADHIEEWFTGNAADAFNLMPSVYKRDFPLFIKHVVPELQRRGLFRTAYAGETLRDSLGLKRPVNVLTKELIAA
ncbi:MAG TPA: LLM class flavin-dependent oxidoreductase, partial [Chthoniobacterales bacterium]